MQDLTHNLMAAAIWLRNGGVGILPTETVYGLAADARNPEAVNRIFQIKGRPNHNPLIIHINSIAHAALYGQWSSLAQSLAEAFWPGPLTLVLNRTSTYLAESATANLDTVAIRFPSHPIMQDILALSNCPLAAPSANLSGRLSPTQALHFQEAFQSAPHCPDFYIASHPSVIGIESTILDLTCYPAQILRPGAITLDMLAEVISREQIKQTMDLIADSPEIIRAPGQLERHYAPNRPLILNAQEVSADEGLLAFGPRALEGAKQTLNLSPTRNLNEAAAHLYDFLYQLDVASHRCIKVMPIPEDGIGIAINDRLRRGAASSQSYS